MTTVVVVDEAEAQLREINEWWIANRTASPTLVVDEFERCVTLLENSQMSVRSSIVRTCRVFVGS